MLSIQNHSKMIRVYKQFLNVLQKQNAQIYSASVGLGRNYCYKSDISLDKLYPNSKLKIFTPPPPESKDGKFSGYIPLNELNITYSRSSGPGGQHVNCVNTKVDIRFLVQSASWIPEKCRQRLLTEHSTKITKDGYLVIKSDVTRSQQMNLADALEKLRCLIRELEQEPSKRSEETLEKLRRRHERAARERLMQKRERSQTKADRQAPSVDL